MKGTIKLETERLILRRFCLSDAQNMYNNWANDKEVTKYLTWLPHASVGVTEGVISDWMNNYDKPDFYQWAICLKDDNVPIGSIGAVSVVGDKAEIGYCLGEKYWFQGYMKEAFKRVIEYLSDEEGFTEISAKHDTENVNSGKVMKKCGLELVGILPSSGKRGDGTVCDLALYKLSK